MKFRSTAAIIALLLVSHIAKGQDPVTPVWRPVTPAELEMKKPQVEPDADAEAIFWDIRIDDKKSNRLTYDHYVRVKIFSERGRERFAKMDIPFVKGKRVENVAARVIRQDGSIVELRPSDVFEREIVRAGKQRVLAKSFAVPGIEPGVIVEYRYTETLKGDSAGGDRLIFQRDIPLQRVTYHVRPRTDYKLYFQPYNMPDVRFAPAQDGYHVGTLDNVPAYREEPFSPPDDEVRKWVYLTYTPIGSQMQWSSIGWFWTAFLDKIAKPDKLIKQKAKELTAGTATNDEALRRIYEYCQKQIRNITYDRTLTEEQREKSDIDDAKEALERRMAPAFMVDLLFAALAQAAGYDVGIALLSDRSEQFFSQEKYPFPSFVRPGAVAVRAGNEWRFFNPGSPFLPYGRLIWYEEHAETLVVGNGVSLWRTTPLAAPADSRSLRTGTFKLSPDGTLEGEVKIEYTGHQAIDRRRLHFYDSPSKLEEELKEEIGERMSAAEVSAISIEHFGDNTRPLTHTFRIRVPGYAQRAGRRLIVQPGFFEFGSKPVFSAAARVNGIYFSYPWSETDAIEIKLPEGFEIDTFDVPGAVRESAGVMSHKIEMSLDKSRNTLVFRRQFEVGGGQRILFPPTAYKPLKVLFDAFHRNDTHAISLKQSGS